MNVEGKRILNLIADKIEKMPHFLKHDHMELEQSAIEGDMFSMAVWNSKSHDYYNESCGTCCCIGGRIELELGLNPMHINETSIAERLDVARRDLDELYYPSHTKDWQNITPQRAAHVIRRFVSTGVVNWVD